MGRAGYTLVELIVVILIIGVLTSFGVPQYLRTLENSKADDAVALVNQVGMTNRMFALDHRGVYAAGQFPEGNGCGCTATSCSSLVITPPTPVAACALVCCSYLGDQDWVNKPYIVNACDPATGTGGGSCAGGIVASTARRSSGPKAAYSPYSGWSYRMTSAGQIQSQNGAPPATY